MATYPRTIESGGGETITFVRLDGDRLIVEGRTTPGAGPAMHMHHRQDEGFTLKAGAIMIHRLGEEPTPAALGETVTFGRGVAHRFWNGGTTEAVIEGWVQPAENVEYFLTALYDSMRANGGTRPGLFDAAFLMRRYRSEFGNLAVPALVQRLLFPLVYACGTILGRYRKYRDAPAPL